MPIEDDFVLRQIDALRRIVAALLLGGRGPEVQEELRQAIDDAYRRLLNMDRTLLDILDPGTIAAMLGDDERIARVAEVMHAEAALHRAAGEAERSRSRRSLALALLERLGPDPEVEQLRARLAESLDPP